MPTRRRDAVLLFSESNTRFLCEVPPDNAAAFEAGCWPACRTRRIGEVTDAEPAGDRRRDGATVVDGRPARR